MYWKPFWEIILSPISKIAISPVVGGKDQQLSRSRWGHIRFWPRYGYKYLLSRYQTLHSVTIGRSFTTDLAPEPLPIFIKTGNIKIKIEKPVVSYTSPEEFWWLLKSCTNKTVHHMNGIIQKKSKILDLQTELWMMRIQWKWQFCLNGEDICWLIIIIWKIDWEKQEEYRRKVSVLS